MRLALVSDIHSNYKAFEAFLEYIEKEKVDAVIGLGDYVTDGPYPERTLKLLHEMMEKYPHALVRGNREQYLIDNAHKSQGWQPSSSNGALFYTSQHITQQDIRFFESLPFTTKLQWQDCPKTFLCHGSPENLRGNMKEEQGLKEKVLKELAEDYLFGGHSHHQEMAAKFGKTYVNPGSLGLAIDGVGRRAQFAMLETVKKDGGIGYEIELCAISYDVDGFLREFTEAGLDEYGMILNRAIKKTLVTGTNFFYYAVVEAIKISGKPLSEIPETVWNEVAVRLDL